MSDWSPELEAQSEADVVLIRERLAVVHASMDDWAVDFLDALDAHDLGKSLDKP